MSNTFICEPIYDRLCLKYDYSGMWAFDRHNTYGDAWHTLCSALGRDDDWLLSLPPGV